jgi:CBS domain-containing protein
MFTVNHVMSRHLVTLKESDSLESADEYLQLGNIRHLPVVRGKKLVGLITHRDLLRSWQRKDARTGRLVCTREAMTRELVTIRPHTPVREAIDLMLNNKFGCLPVTEEDGTLVGIITESDLLRVAYERAEELDRAELAAEY